MESRTIGAQTVMVVGGDPAAGIVVARLLDHYGYRVWIEANREEALSDLRRGLRPDVIVAGVDPARPVDARWLREPEAVQIPAIVCGLDAEAEVPRRAPTAHEADIWRLPLAIREVAPAA